VEAERTQDRLHWLDIIRGLSIGWIFLVHFVERFMTGSYFANPGSSWPPLIERFEQLLPLPLEGAPGLFANALRYTGWLGDQGVQLFLVASGFGLAYAALRAGGPENGTLKPLRFYARRLGKIFPLWWSAHLVFILTWLLIGRGMDVTDWRTTASFFGLRFLPRTMYYFSPAWWFIGLILQLYLVFPFLYRFLNKLEPVRFLLVIGGGAVAVRLLGLVTMSEYLDWWSRGAFFIPRLPEFAFGMVFAKILVEDDARLVRWTRGTGALLFWVTVYLAGNTLSFFKAGMAAAFLFTGAGAFVLLYMAAAKVQKPATGVLCWCGKHSYPIYLVHHPVLLFLVPAALAYTATAKIVGLLLATGALSAGCGFVLERATRHVTGAFRRSRGKHGVSKTAFRAALVLISAFAVLAGAEYLVRAVFPQEVLGWGERPALEPHDEFGYHLKPDVRTRLRWLGYDYVVESNALGFPGPLYPAVKPEGVYRILVTGDAFSSAEGVDTHDAWPRLLEENLNADQASYQVLNFSITGWGPNQYTQAVQTFAPIYRPDLIIVSFFVNEFADVRKDNQDFSTSIGFDRPSPDSIGQALRFHHVRALLKSHLVGRIRELVTGEPYRLGYFLGGFTYLERKNLDLLTTAAPLIEERLERIVESADRVGAEVLLLMVPASPQVQGDDPLPYYPRSVDVTDSDRFDLGQPQRLTQKICAGTGIRCLDLRPPLIAVRDRQPYHPGNMHWTKAGHRAVAGFLASHIKASRSNGPSTP
jgi:peptidoglycan/LPS O-acetylase OafA/YrhL